MDVVSVAISGMVGLCFLALGIWVGRRMSHSRMIELETEIRTAQEAKNTLKESFQALSAQALENNTSSFLRLAQNQFEHLIKGAQNDWSHRQDKITDLVTPVRESLEKVGQKMEAIEKSRAQSESALKEQLRNLQTTHQQLQSETSSLVAALKAPQTRGRWGEMQLKRCVEMAGMIEYCDFKLQESKYYRPQGDQSEQLRPDMIVRLPSNKLVVVDAKTPLSSYLEALEQNELSRKTEKLKEHARHVKKHIDDLSKKAYWAQFKPGPEFVVLFMPGESIFSAALEQDPSLIESGVRQNVILATPTTLIALLRAVAYGWQQERLAANIREVGKLGQELYKRLSDMGVHFSRLGKSLHQSVEAYNKTVGSLESRVLVTARKMNELKVAQDADELPELETLDIQARQAQSPELSLPPPES